MEDNCLCSSIQMKNQKKERSKSYVLLNISQVLKISDNSRWIFYLWRLVRELEEEQVKGKVNRSCQAYHGERVQTCRKCQIIDPHGRFLLFSVFGKTNRKQNRGSSSPKPHQGLKGTDPEVQYFWPQFLGPGQIPPYLCYSFHFHFQQ